MSTYHCTSCRRAIFHADAIIDRVTLSAFDGHRADVYRIREAIEPGSLRRYDVSLHEGWYCCRFIMMRMTRDKFGTGASLLVYADSVAEIADETALPSPASRPVIKLTARDHDDVIASEANRGKLVVVKHGAIWCPPCRHMDATIDKLVAAGAMRDVQFFDVDVDEEPALAGRFANGSIPFFVFYKDGVQVPVELPNVPTVDGGIVGALPARALQAICARLA